MIDPRCPRVKYVVRLRDLREAVLRTDVNQSRPWMHDIRIDALQLLDELAVGVRVIVPSRPRQQPLTPTAGHDPATDAAAAAGDAADPNSARSNEPLQSTPLRQQQQQQQQQQRRQQQQQQPLQQQQGSRRGSWFTGWWQSTSWTDLGDADGAPRAVKVVPFSKLFTRHAPDGSANAVIVVLEMYARQCAWVKSPRPVKVAGKA